MGKTFYYLFKEIRPRQWIKNLTVFAAIFFTGKLFDTNLFQISLVAFISFCCASSTVYIVNDLIDIEKDRLHPFKKFRPIASEKISKFLAIFTALILFTISIISAFSISSAFIVLLISFYLLNISYSLVIKHIMLLDILAIALGFILRFLGGEIATGYHLSIWILLTVISAALFLAIGKRRSELTLLSNWKENTIIKTRSTLSHYSEKMLDVYLSMFANSAWITYALYTFLEQPPIFRTRISTIFDQYNLGMFEERKWMTITIPIVIYGVMRYLQLIYEKNEGESPEKVLFSDKPLMLTAIILGLLTFGIIYIIRK